MPLHTKHNFNTKFQLDPAIERWAYQRYFGQFGKFKFNAFALKWVFILYGAIPVTLFYLNEQGTKWLDQFKDEDINSLRMGRVDPELFRK